MSRNVNPVVLVSTAIGLLAATLWSLPAAEAGSDTSCLPGALKSRLVQIRKKFGNIEVISTYRGGARMPNGRASLHASCRAVDFHPPRGKYGQVASWLKSNHGGGVGTYSCGMHHIHIDNGPRVRFHHCQSAGNDGEGTSVVASDTGRAAAGAAGTTRLAGWPLILPRR